MGQLYPELFEGHLYQKPEKQMLRNLTPNEEIFPLSFNILAPNLNLNYCRGPQENPARTEKADPSFLRDLANAAATAGY